MSRGVSISWWLAALLLLAAGGGAWAARAGTLWLASALALALVVGWLVGRFLVRDWAKFSLPGADREGAELSPRLCLSPVREVRELARRLRKAHREISRVFQSQRDFTAHAAHELRTPLAALRIAGESALRAAHPEAWRDAIGGMLEETERAERVIDQLLLLARAESGQMEVRPKPWPLADLVTPVVELLEPLARMKNQRVLVPPPTDWTVHCDADLFRLVLGNLLANAIRHSGEGAEISLQVSRWPTGGVVVDVVDDGPGVAPGDEERIFERFHRGSGTAGEGTGLGLPIARWAADAFGGKVLYQRRLGHGSVFRFFCPESEWDHFEEPTTPASPGVPEDWAAAAAPSQLLVRLGTTRRGLTEAEARSRLAAQGPNTPRQRDPMRPWIRLGRILASPFNGVLAVSTLFSLLLREDGAALVMLTMIALSTWLRYWQESRAERAARALGERIRPHTWVSRHGMTAPVSCPVEDLVPGDIVHLRPGSMVPADLRLLSADDLELSEATFSGRPVPVAKSAAAEHADRNNRRHICYCGTHVLRGGGIGVVFATGARTRLGEMARRTSPHRPPGPFEKGVREVSMALLAFMVALVPTVFFLNGILKGNWTEAFLFGLAAAIGLTPELLPMMVNVNLARAAGVLARRGVITRTLPAVQELGSIDVLCVEPAGGGIRSEGATSSTPDLARLLAEAREEGVEIRLLTEEPVGSLEALRESLGLTRAAVLEGSEVASLADESLAERCGQTFLFAGLAPSDKARVVTALQSKGHRVGFLGGGANDANALRAADVGIVQTGAADLALDCAGVVLTTREPEALAAAMAEGRTAFGNILKYIKITASSNLGNAVSVVVASLLLPFLPIKAVLLLVQNLLYDLTQFSLPWDRVDASFRKVPRAWSADSLVRFMLVFAPVSCVFDLLTFGVLWWGVGARTPEAAPLFHTGWFSVGLLTQLMIVHVLRTGKPLWQSPPATAPLFLATLMAAAVGLILPHLPLASSLGFSILPAWFYVWLALVLCAYAATAEVVKRWYVARTGQWL